MVLKIFVSFRKVLVGLQVNFHLFLRCWVGGTGPRLGAVDTGEVAFMG